MEIYWDYEKKDEIVDLLGKEVIVEGDCIGDEAFGFINKTPIISKKIIIAKCIKPI